MNKAKGKRRIYLIIVGLLLIAAALLLCLYNYLENAQAEEQAEKTLSVLSTIIANNKAEIASGDGNSADDALEAIDNKNEDEDADNSSETDSETGDEDVSSSSSSTSSSSTSSTDSTSSSTSVGAVNLPEMPTVTVDGVEYIGVISLPKYGIELPVLSSWSYSGLKTGPGRYSGTLEDNNLILCGHNYRAHFGHLNSTKVGETIIFTDIYGNEYTYTVVKVETIAGDDAASMLADEDEWDLTLFSCTLSGTTRATVRCKLAD
ncbi:MAG: sortase [Firmicutes bacterium]|nr:sortase [Bacillota bacterium]